VGEISFWLARPLNRRKLGEISNPNFPVVVGSLSEERLACARRWPRYNLDLISSPPKDLFQSVASKIYPPNSTLFGKGDPPPPPLPVQQDVRARLVSVLCSSQKPERFFPFWPSL